MLKSQYEKYGLDASPIPVMIIPSKIVIKYNSEFEMAGFESCSYLVFIITLNFTQISR